LHIHAALWIIGVDEDAPVRTPNRGLSPQIRMFARAV